MIRAGSSVVEQLSFKQHVVGSIPTRPPKFLKYVYEMSNRTFLTISTGVIIIWLIIGAFLFLTKPIKPVIETEFFSLGMEICYACEEEAPTPEN